MVLYAPLGETNEMKIHNFALVAATAAAFLLCTVPAKSLPVPGQNAQDPQNDNRPAAQAPQDQDRDQDRDRDARQNPQEADSDQEIRLPEGTIIPVRLADDVNSNHDKEGALFTGTVDPSVLIHDTVVIPRGTEAHIRMVEAKKGGHIEGKAKVRLELVSLIINGQRLGVDTNAPGKEKGAVSAKTSAMAKKGAKTGGGSAAAGAAGVDPTSAAGPIIAAFTAPKVEVKAGSRVEFRLESPFAFEKPAINSSSNSEQH
jgi:hypothetical protein